MIKIIKYSNENGLKEISLDDITKWDYECTENIWVDICNATESESQNILENIFQFHPLAIEDALKYIKDHSVHLPKLEDFGEYLFIVFNGIKQETKTFRYGMFSLSCFLGHNFLVTIHNEPGENTFLKSLKNVLNERTFRKGPDYILNLILDEIVDRYYPLIDTFEEESDKIEEDLFNGIPDNSTLKRILNLKRELLKLRRISTYQKEILFKLIRGDSELISLEESVYYRNVYDHLVRVSDTAESYRDYTAGMLDSYLSIVNNKMNEVMKFLTIIATIVLPLTLITGVFGMNFDFIPLLHDTLGFVFSMGLMSVVAIGMLLWFRHKKWI